MNKNFKINMLNFDRNYLPIYFQELMGSKTINILEIGTYEGNYAQHIHQNYLNCMLYLLDTWNSSDTDLFYFNKNDLMTNAYEKVTEKFKNIKNVKIIKCNSKIAYDKFPDNFFDWIYIDADHSYHGVKSDLIKYYNKLKIDGIFSGHDWDVDPSWDCKHMFGVQEAVCEFGDSITNEIYVTNELYHKSWFFYKKV